AGDRTEGLTEILTHHAERALSLSLEVRLGGSVLLERARRALSLALASAARASKRQDASVVGAFLATARAAIAAFEREGASLGASERAQIALLEAQQRVIGGDYSGARVALVDAVAAAETADRLDL